MWQRWRSHHLIPVSENPVLRANFMALCFTEPELLPIDVLHCGNRDFQHFLLLWPWPWLDDLHIRTQPVFSGDIPDVQIWTSYGKAFESYRQTDIHKWNYIPRCFVDGQLRRQQQSTAKCHLLTTAENVIELSFSCKYQHVIFVPQSWVHIKNARASKPMATAYEAMAVQITCNTQDKSVAISLLKTGY